MKTYEVPLIAVSTSVAFIEADDFKDACKKVYEDANTFGWSEICEDLYDYPDADIDWKLLAENTKELCLMEVDKDILPAGEKA